MKRPNYDGLLTKQNAPRELKADAAEGIITGYASKWWEIDSYGECTAPGCFEKTIKERGPKSARPRIVFRYEHFNTVGTHLEIEEDAIGLPIKAKVVDDGMYGTTLRRHLEEGIPYGLSIGFRNIAMRPGTEDDPFIWDNAPKYLRSNPDPTMIMVLTEVKLLENSAVSFPAVDSATIDGYRHDTTADELERLLTAIKAGRMTPEQRGVAERIVSAWLAAGLPETGETPEQPRSDPDGLDDERLFFELELTLAERYAA